MKPVTIVHTEASRGWGGQEIRIFTEMLAMRERGHRLLLAAPEACEIFRRSQAAGLPVFPFSDAKLAYPKSILRLANFFRAERVQVVNMHSSRDGWLGGFAARLAKVPCIIRSRHIEVDYPNRFTSRIAFHHLPHHVLTTSGKISGRLIAELSLDSARITCLPTGIDLRRFDPATPSRLREELKLPPQTRLVGMISVLRSWKGHAFFLEAARELAQKHSNVHFIIAGDGPGREALPGRIAEHGLQSRVSCLGHRDDVPQVLAALDVLALPSTAHEGIPQIILQAQAMQRAVVGTTVGGIPEVISDGETGLLVPPKDGPALARALERLLTDDALRERLARAGRAQAQREHSLEVMCGRLEAIYQKYLPHD